VRTVPTAALSLAFVLIAAVPASAAPVVAKDAQRFWFYWIAPLLVLGGLAAIGALLLGYYVRVLRPKWRGRKVS
jgi:hypothetical protein